VLPYDQQSFGLQVNSSNKTVIIGVPPVVNLIQCLRNNAVWVNCSTLVFGDNFSGVRTNCTNFAASIVNVSFNLTNIQDNNTFFNVSISNHTSDLYTYYYNMTIDDSGDFLLMSTCTNNNSVKNTGTISWFLPWGKLYSSLVNPNSNIAVEYGQIFTFTSNVTCIGGECGNILALLDPGFVFGSPSSGVADNGVEYLGTGDFCLWSLQ